MCGLVTPTYGASLGDSPIGSMLESKKTGKLYFDNDSQNYYEISSRKDNYDKNGKIVSADITVDVYNSYTYDKEQGKYVGVDKVGTSTSTVYYGEAAKKMFIQLQGGS